MSPDEFNLAAAAARARCAVHGVRLDAGDLEPPHPAFAAFRRMTYLWEDGLTAYPIGDRAAIWLDFLGERGCREAWLVSGAGFELRVDHAGGRDGWSATDLEGAPLLRGRPAQPGTTGEPAGRSVHGEDRAVVAASDAAAGDDASSIASAGHALREAAEREAASTASPVDRDALRRAVAILDSAGDGGEVSDVAWPYFLLPEAAFTSDARRLLAAAASAWACPEARHAAAAAVNHGLLAEQP